MVSDQSIKYIVTEGIGFLCRKFKYNLVLSLRLQKEIDMRAILGLDRPFIFWLQSSEATAFHN